MPRGGAKNRTRCAGKGNFCMDGKTSSTAKIQRPHSNLTVPPLPDAARRKHVHREVHRDRTGVKQVQRPNVQGPPRQVNAARGLRNDSHGRDSISGNNTIVVVRGKIECVERVWAKFSSHEEARQANLAYYRGLTPQQRLDILLELISLFRKEGDASSERLERVCRISQLQRG